MSEGISRRSFIENAGVTGSQIAPAKKDRLTIVGVCCSPRKGKTTASALEIRLAGAEKVSDRIEREMIELADFTIPAQLVPGAPLDEVEKDDFFSLVPTLDSPNVVGAQAAGGGRNGGRELTIQSVLVAPLGDQMMVVGDGTPAAHWGGEFCGIKSMTTAAKMSSVFPPRRTWEHESPKWRFNYIKLELV